MGKLFYKFLNGIDKTEKKSTFETIKSLNLNTILSSRTVNKVFKFLPLS